MDLFAYLGLAVDVVLGLAVLVVVVAASVVVDVVVAVVASAVTVVVVIVGFRLFSDGGRVMLRRLLLSYLLAVVL